jgi:hypothetical protein
MLVSKIVSAVALGALLGCSAAADPRALVEGGGVDAGAGGSMTVCPYPPGPYGISHGSTVSASLHWQGFVEGMTQSTDVSIADFHDCEGAKGIDAVLFDVSAGWCGACQQEAADFASLLPTWTAKGIQVVTLLIQDAAGNPATIATAEAWRQTYKLDETATLADPSVSLVPVAGGGLGLPYQVVLDPRTMTIANTQEGYSGDYSALLAVAAKNRTP